LSAKQAIMKLFRFIAFLEGLSYLLLLFIASPVKYFSGDPTFVKLLGMPHGVLFMAYIGFALFYKVQQKWTLKSTLIILLASVVPFGTFYIDKTYLRK
jgi:integral membrane protein|tara:strand:- start:1982 stop:2275 length:294 start_codon:yes stop_codon:yes gene_type:complete